MAVEFVLEDGFGFEGSYGGQAFKRCVQMAHHWTSGCKNAMTFGKRLLFNLLKASNLFKLREVRRQYRLRRINTTRNIPVRMRELGLTEAMSVTIPIKTNRTWK
jgi:hypothetical protein